MVHHFYMMNEWMDEYVQMIMIQNGDTNKSLVNGRDKSKNGFKWSMV